MHFSGRGERHPCTHCIDPLAEPGSPSLGPDSRRLLRGNKPKAESLPGPFVGVRLGAVGLEITVKRIGRKG